MATALSAQPLPLPRSGAAPLPSPPHPSADLAVPRLSVVIVNYCQWSETAQLVHHLLENSELPPGTVEVVLIDNHSPPHRLAKQLRRRPGVVLRRWGRNRGFARAVNEGVWLSRGEWVLLLNPDVSVPPGFAARVLRLAQDVADGQPRAGIVGFQLRNTDGTRQHSAGPLPTLLRTLAGLALPRARRKYHLRPSRRRCRVPWVTGCCLLLQRQCLADVGGLDEDFFLYYEDVDLCRRARAAGWSVWYEPRLRVTHHHPLHGRPVGAYLRVLTRHALLTYAAKHWPGWQFQALTWIVRAEAWLRRQVASYRGDGAAAWHLGQLGKLAASLGLGDTRDARRRLERLVRREEQRRAG